VFDGVQGVAGISCLWRVADYWRERHGLPEQLPPEMAERLRPARQKALQKVPSVAQAVGGASDDEAGGDDDEAEEYDPGELPLPPTHPILSSAAQRRRWLACQGQLGAKPCCEACSSTLGPPSLQPRRWQKCTRRRQQRATSATTVG
jgi:hypothetical protein